ncbi:MAG: DUF1080 domain-containing protein [Verrucomicrobiales bacterium]|nr:DUF1080 domain-containing protein [Verrucomicrobiales bacterium]
MISRHSLHLRLLSSVLALTSSLAITAEDENWLPLFNGKDLTGWTPKIRYEEYGNDSRKTFRVEDGVLKVSYENYTEFNESFGHLFYETPYSHYRLRLEYRFTGEQVKGGPRWAFRNSGIMVHGQDPATMIANQDFPVSIEVQLLGGDGKRDRTNANLCTPGTHVFMKEKLVKKHCINSSSKTFHGDDWVTVEVEVRGHEVIRHFAEGDLVLSYQKPVLDAEDANAEKIIDKAGGNIELSGGTISLQSESHPVEFRKVEILVLVD